MPVEKQVTDDLEALLIVLPPHIREPLEQREDTKELLEVVLDLGRLPEARFPSCEATLSHQEVTERDLDYVVSHIGSFGDDNRAGIERTLHRLSAIRNRHGRIVGLTCRVGRAIFGTIEVIRDIVGSGKSILLLGRPGVGKTTMLREVARVLAVDLKKRVIIVDTSNEIAGDGDIPHPAIGHARRMQVPTPTMQHAVMIEAVENHMPEVIVIDEIGTELEAQAARTIAERGVQLVGTAHGNTLDNLIMNPTLADLVGGIQTVTLGDEEARRRGTQKSILERKAPPTFDVIVEIQGWDRVAIHHNVGEAVDSLLRGQPLATEVRWRDEKGEVRSKKTAPLESDKPAIAGQRELHKGTGSLKVYPFGLNRSLLEKAGEEVGIPMISVLDLRQADVVLTSKHHYRLRPEKLREAETEEIPIYVLKSNTLPQMRRSLETLIPSGSQDTFSTALAEAREAAERVGSGKEEGVELSPQSSYVRRLQHLLAERYNLSSHSLGKEPQRRVRVFKGT